MKKLLVILLLLFPVQGAWAEILTLSCSTYEGRRTGVPVKKVHPPIVKVHNIDLINKVVDGAVPLDLLTNNWIKWHWLKNTHEAGKVVVEYISINRFEGRGIYQLSELLPLLDAEKKYKFEHTIRPDMAVIFIADCKKIETKRKF